MCNNKELVIIFIELNVIKVFAVVGLRIIFKLGNNILVVIGILIIL